MKLCIITCYNQPDYVRAKTLRAAAAKIDGVDISIVKNSRIGLLRYFEVFIKVVKLRFTDNPDVYLLTFRGYEMLLPVRLISLGKPLIYDEFINPIEWVALEKRQVEASQRSNGVYATLVSLVSKIIVSVVRTGLFKTAYRALVSSVQLVLADTDSHADASAGITGIRRSKIVGLFVGTDEQTFRVQSSKPLKGDVFTVFYYGNMLPLHGLKYVIDTAAKMKDKPIQFVLVGGNAAVAGDVKRAKEGGANINYRAWVDFEKLPELMNQADVCLAGPFGNTFQAQYVITGKTYQYLAMGRPTIIGKNEESHHFIDKQNVLIVPQADPEGLASTLQWAMEHKAELPQIGKSGRELYDAEFSVQVLSTHLQSILSRVTGMKLGSGTN